MSDHTLRLPSSRAFVVTVAVAAACGGGSANVPDRGSDDTAAGTQGAGTGTDGPGVATGGQDTSSESTTAPTGGSATTRPAPDPMDPGVEPPGLPPAAKCEPGPAKPVAPPQSEAALAVPAWWTRVVTRVSDPVRQVLEWGTFTLPDASSQSWAETPTGANGALRASPGNFVYAAAEIEVPEGRYLLARADSVTGIYTNAAFEQAGDPDHSRTRRVPLAAKAGKNVVVVRALGEGRDGPAEVELFTTTSTLYFNDAAALEPTFPAGDRTPQYVGIPVLNLGDDPASCAVAEVIEDENFEGTRIAYPGLPAHAVTQVAWEIKPKVAPKGSGSVKVKLRLSAKNVDLAYETTAEVRVVGPGTRYDLARRSAVDGSVQHYAVVPPSGFDAAKDYGLILSLHGAAMRSLWHAEAYAPKSWAYVIAPTNRGRWGFNWEHWGRLDAVEALAHARERFRIDPTRIHLGGHSMGGHGTWHVGVHFAGHFGVVSPSAGWQSYYTYGGLTRPTGLLARAQAASDTMVYLSNLARKPVFILHASRDPDVPSSESEVMYKALMGVTDDLVFHKEDSGSHFWDRPGTPGRDSVDLAELMTVMEARRREPVELDFRHIFSAPWVNDRRSFVSVRSQTTVREESEVTSKPVGTAGVEVTTKNVRSMVLDGAALRLRGIDTLSVDGTAHEVADGPIAIGPQTGKEPAVYGPIEQMYHRPFCFVYDPAGRRSAEVIAQLTSWWTAAGNGQSCAVSLAEIATAAEGYNLIYVGVPSSQIPGFPASLGIEFSDQAIVVGGQKHENAAATLVFPGANGRLSGAYFATTGAEPMLFWGYPFTSARGVPDYVVHRKGNKTLQGFFDADWKLSAQLAEFVESPFPS